MKKRILGIAILIFALFAVTACAEKSPDYIIVSDKAFAPFVIYDEKTGEYSGIDIEILEAVSEEAGFTYELRHEGFSAAMTTLNEGKADAMMAAVTITEERKETLDFSESYFSDGRALVVYRDSKAESIEDIKGGVIAAKRGTVSQQYAQSLAEEYGFTVTVFEDTASVYQAIISGAADACFEDYSAAGWAIERDGMALKIVGEKADPSGYGLAVRRGTHHELVNRFNEGFDKIIKNGKYDEILHKYGF